MAEQIQGDVVAEYTPILTIPGTGDVLTEASFYDTAIALANRIEYVRSFTQEASAAPESFCFLREDFLGAIWTDSQSRLDGAFPWRTNDTGSPSVNGNAGQGKNPGLLIVALPANGADAASFEFHLISNTGAPFTYATFEQATVVVRIAEDAANLTEFTRFGLVDDASLANGGDDALMVIRQPATGGTKWGLIRRVGGSQTTTTITAADFTNSAFAVWRMLKNSDGDVELYLDGDLVHTVDSADLPSGGCNFSCMSSVTAADTEVYTVSWDLVSIRTAPGDRSGA